MGCDIHWFAESQNEDGKWIPRLVIEPRRQYCLFSALAGVRREESDPPPRFEPQHAIPDDASSEVRAEAAEWDVDGHSFSYRTLAELQAHDWSEFPSFVEVLESMATMGHPDRVRAVFWFDN